MIAISDYYWLRQRIPIFAYFFYVYFKKSDNPAFKGLVRTVMSLSSLATIYVIMGYIFKIPFRKMFDISWHYPGFITWGLFSMIYYGAILKKNYNDLTALGLAIIATTGGGWLYEFPFNPNMSAFIEMHTIFLFDGQIMCLLFLGYELRKRGLQINLLICAMFCLYVGFSIICFLDFWGLVKAFGIWSGNGKLFQWLYRVPACLFLLSLIGGIENGS